MSADLYNPTILRLAATIPHHSRLPDPQGSAAKRSPICGSRVTVDVRLDGDGRVAELGLEVRACALGQASASLMGAHAIGRSLAELEAACDALTAFLAGERADPGDWPGIDIFRPAVAYPARHASIRLAFEGVVEAVGAARVAA
ncbi:iron-sulfur cluster assembly scaffold protein [Sphingomonas montanisoli]|uniref:Iron-sulfur cluster assembly scaffold protein n=2 Tax=Sphingomonas montanisoli TaxID=2606412 RepID=A0A5D9CDI2_9SPHN|nr:iron-sulfur cluster assembly scaffold protein [Sphingomonas montanisoli]